MKPTLVSAAILLCQAAFGLAADGAVAGEGNFPIRKVIDRTIDARLEACGAFDPASLPRFLDYPPNPVVANSSFPIFDALFSSPFKPNPKFWAKGIDFSCASPWNSGGGRLRAGTAISPRHIVFAKHFQLWRNVRVVFVGSDGLPCACHVEKTKALPDCDIMIASLNAELPPTVRPAKILPMNFTNFTGKVEGLPVVTLNQFEKAYVSELMIPLTNSVYDLVSYHEPAVKGRKPYREKIRSGDSGGPVFMVVNNEPILLFCLTTTMGGYGLHLFRREIQKTMDELCPGYKLEEFDFGMFQSTTTQGNP